ncbi:MAG: hypothetical protein NXI26_02705, partial [bacterium]|nr:hypothetical protein [bacterium]
ETMPAGSPNTSLVTLGLSSFAPLSCKITALTLLINFPNISRAKGQLVIKKERLWQIAQLVQQHEYISFTLTEEKRCFTELSIDIFELRLQK